MAFIAGRYSATYNGSALGQTEDGIRLIHSVFKRLITGDAGGQTPQNAVYQGMEAFVQYTLLEYNAAGAAAALWPYGSGYLNASAMIGTLDSAHAKQLVLTAVAGTPAANTPATITLPNVILAEGFPVEILFAPDLRTVPIRQRIYPDSSMRFGTLT